MPKFKKIVLGPGVYQSPDGEISITPERIKNWANKFHQMKKMGLNIPTPWGHLSDAYPDYEAKEFFESKYNAGFIDELEVDDKDNLVAIIDTPRDEDASKIGTTVREVSPQIETEWRDGKGRIWQDVITHLALVTHPVVPGQSNFEPVPENAVRLSLSMRKRDMADKKDEKKEKEESKPVYKKEEKKEEKKEPETEVVETPVETPEDSSEVDSELLEVLEQIGIVLPDDTTSETLPSRLKAAAMTLAHKMQEIGEGQGQAAQGEQALEQLLSQPQPGQKGGQQPAEEDTEDMQDQTSKNSGQKPEEQPPSMTMSLAKNELDSYKTRLSLMEKKAEESDRARMKAEVKVLLEEGKISPVIAQKLNSSISGYRLSLNDKGESINLVQDKIDMFKLMPVGSAWSSEEKVRLRNAAEQDLPMEFTNLTDENADKLAEEQLRVSNRQATYNF